MTATGKLLPFGPFTFIRLLSTIVLTDDDYLLIISMRESRVNTSDQGLLSSNRTLQQPRSFITFVVYQNRLRAVQDMALLQMLAMQFLGFRISTGLADP